MDQFTHRVEKALHEAQNLALAEQHPELRPLHLLSAFGSLDESLLIEICDDIGARQQLRECVTKRSLNSLSWVAHPASCE